MLETRMELGGLISQSVSVVFWVSIFVGRFQVLNLVDLDENVQ